MWVKSDNGYSKSYTDNLVLMSNAMTEPQWLFKFSSLRSVPRVANREGWIDPIAGLVAVLAHHAGTSHDTSGYKRC